VTSPSPDLPIVTPLQFAFLTALAGKALTGEQMRTELARCGVHRSRPAFFRVIQRLKQANLVSADRIPRPEGESPGAQCVYELTRDGVGAMGVVRSMCRRVERRVWRLRWRRGSQTGLRSSFHAPCFASRHLPPRTVVRETTDGSQVTELLTNVRSGRRRLAALRFVSRCKSTGYGAIASLGTPDPFQNSFDPNARASDLSLHLVDSRLQVVGLMPRIADPTLRFFKIASSNHRLRPATRQFEPPICRVEAWSFEIRGFKSPIRSRKSTGPGGRSLVSNHPFAYRLPLQTRIKHEPSLRFVPSHGRGPSQPCTKARQTTAGPNSPICCNSKGEHHVEISNQRS
jgi:hypothetical protein